MDTEGRSQAESPPLGRGHGEQDWSCPDLGGKRNRGQWPCVPQPAYLPPPPAWVPCVKSYISHKPPIVRLFPLLPTFTAIIHRPDCCVSQLAAMNLPSHQNNTHTTAYNPSARLCKTLYFVGCCMLHRCWMTVNVLPLSYSTYLNLPTPFFSDNHSSSIADNVNPNAHCLTLP